MCPVARRCTDPPPRHGGRQAGRSCGERQMTSTSNELAAFTAVLAREAGELLLEFQLKRHELATETKSSQTDLVSTADRASETLVRKRISERYPTDSIVGEEHASRVGTSGREWIVDPLDGTTNFLFGVPAWAVSIACHDSTALQPPLFSGTGGVRFDRLGVKRRSESRRVAVRPEGGPPAVKSARVA
jgi:myo-inositol-1(or 4)-monophosphatase